MRFSNNSTLLGASADVDASTAQQFIHELKLISLGQYELSLYFVYSSIIRFKILSALKAAPGFPHFDQAEK